MMKGFKRAFYIEQLRLLGIIEVGGVPVYKMTDRELKFILTMARVKKGG